MKKSIYILLFLFATVQIKAQHEFAIQNISDILKTPEKEWQKYWVPDTCVLTSFDHATQKGAEVKRIICKKNNLGQMITSFEQLKDLDFGWFNSKKNIYVYNEDGVVKSTKVFHCNYKLSSKDTVLKLQKEILNAYDVNGNLQLQKEVLYDFAGEILSNSVRKMSYNDKKLLIKKILYNDSETKKATDSIVYFYNYKKITRKQHYSLTTDSTLIHTYHYDDNDLLLKIRALSIKNGKNRFIYEYIYKYNVKGVFYEVVYNKFLENDIKQKEQDCFSFELDGERRVGMYYSHKSKNMEYPGLRYYFKYSYDDQDRLIEKQALVFNRMPKSVYEANCGRTFFTYEKYKKEIDPRLILPLIGKRSFTNFDFVKPEMEEFFPFLQTKGCLRSINKYISIENRGLLSHVTLELKGKISSVEIKEICSNQNLELYPNPADSYLQFNANPERIYQLEIFDIKGNVFLCKAITGKQRCNISFLKQGVYICRMRSEQEILVRKFIVKR
ncbi:MAG: T9SS type A sorting domain-containing protein [Bacteroidales bacterium]